jgi:serine/threonine protein kinase
MSLAAGTKLGPYGILALIGSGGMGEVYRARDPRLHSDVAIKILPAEFAADAGRMARFEREAKVLASLSSTAETANAEPAGMDADSQGTVTSQDQCSTNPLRRIGDYTSR